MQQSGSPPSPADHDVPLRAKTSPAPEFFEDEDDDEMHDGEKEVI